MYRAILAVAAIGVITVVGVLGSSVSIVDGQEGGTPGPSLVTPAADPCEVGVAATPAGTPAIADTPAADLSFDVVYLDLVMAHTERLAGVAKLAADHAEHDELSEFGSEMAAHLDERARRLGVWRSLWFGEQPVLMSEELIGAVERLGEATPGRGGIPGGFEVLGMTGLVEEACAAADDAALLELLIGAVDADLLLARAAIEQAEHHELRLEAAAIADRDQRWIDGLIALRERWYGDGATPAASPMAVRAS
ncbi:MAG: hypothetical protein ACRDJW_05740 [Thermomicrobiales bacterium]